MCYVASQLCAPASVSRVVVQEARPPICVPCDISESGSAAQRSRKAEKASHSCSPSPQVEPAHTWSPASLSTLKYQVLDALPSREMCA